MIQGALLSGAQVSSTGREMDPESKKALEKVCSDFESIFIYQLLQELRKTVPKGGFLSGGGCVNSTYDMVVYQKVAQDMAERGGGIGVREMLFNQISGKYRAG
ncbi:MAG: rod-binding protein [Syntrophales bacterium]|nr:rod-binding protein [Syntrophales bacterium]